MSQPSRPRARSSEPRRRRQYRIEGPQTLEERQLLTPFLTTAFTTAAVTNVTTTDLGGGLMRNFGSVTLTRTEGVANSAAPFTSISQLTPTSSFGGDIVRIEAGPGGDFGKAVYAISRGRNTAATDTTPQTLGGHPGLIYRVDPATGQTSLFFDLNTVIRQITPGSNASNDGGPSTGLVNWYDLAFDPEGVFDGRPSLFVSSVDRDEPNKNVIYRIGPDGSFLGAFVPFTEGLANLNFTRTPSAILVPPVEQQNFLRGLLSGNGASDTGFTGTGFTALFFDAQAFRPGTPVAGPGLPEGALPTSLTLAPQTGLTAANQDYPSLDYATFADFGTPAGGGIPAFPGFSGVQGLQGELLISNPTLTGFFRPGNPAAQPPTGGLSAAAANLINTPATATTPSGVDQVGAITTPFRRFQDTAFDHYGYFSQGAAFTAGTAGGAPTATPIPPNFAGSLFVADLATGLAVSPAFGTAPAVGTSNNPGSIPIQGFTTIVTLVNTTPDPDQFVSIDVSDPTLGNLGGRIIRIDPDGVVRPFAEGFNTSGRQDAGSFVESSLSITFSADGTTLYAADNDGIWQFKTVASLAGSTTGSLIGLNDLRSLGVPYQGQDSAVAIIDTGVDARTPNFRGRVAEGFNTLTRGPGNDDTAGTATANGHGTLLAGVVAQFVPQATLVPVNVFTPNLAAPGNTTSQLVFEGLDFVADNPFARDPVRPNKVDRIIAADMGFGTTETFDVEGTAYRAFPQIVLAFKSQLQRFRHLGITPVAAAGQFGVPFNAPPPALVGDVQGMALPAVLNEVVSVTGTYSFPFSNFPFSATQGAAASPLDPESGFLGRLFSPILLGRINAPPFPGNLTVLTTADTIVFKDKILNAANRGLTTDYAAPAVDVPTFRRTFAGDLNQHNVFQEGGTSLSSAIVTGSFAVVASALDYFDTISKTGVTADAYLTTPVGARVLNFGPHQIRDLSIYANPDGVNSILQWTAVPVTDAPILGETFLNQPNLFGSPRFREFSRIDIGNAVASIEASVALEYLFKNGTFTVIDANNNKLITAQEIQTFVDQAASIGLPEAGALARFLGGTARPPGEQPIIDPANALGGLTSGQFLGLTRLGEQPDRPDVLQRRYNFLDFAADGQINGALSIDQLTVLAHTLLPPPDSFVIVDRQRASINNYLLEAHAGRNISDLQHTLTSYAFVPARAVRRFRHISPARFKVGRGIDPRLTTPIFTLFDPSENQPDRPSREQRTARTQTPATDGDSSPTATPTTSRTTPSTTTPSTTTPSTTTPSTTTPSTTTPSQPGATADPFADAINALRRLANLDPGATAATTDRVPGQTRTSPTLGDPQPAGTLTPTSSTPTPATPTATTPTSPTATPTADAKVAPSPAQDGTPPAAAAVADQGDTSGSATAPLGADQAGVPLPTDQSPPQPATQAKATRSRGLLSSLTRRGRRG